MFFLHSSGDLNFTKVLGVWITEISSHTFLLQCYTCEKEKKISFPFNSIFLPLNYTSFKSISTIQLLKKVTTQIDSYIQIHKYSALLHALHQLVHICCLIKDLSFIMIKRYLLLLQFIINHEKLVLFDAYSASK